MWIELWINTQWKTFLTLDIHSSSHLLLTLPHGVVEELESVPPAFGQEVGVHPGSLQVRHTVRNNRSHSSLSQQFSSPPNACLWTVWGSRRARNEPSQTACKLHREKPPGHPIIIRTSQQKLPGIFLAHNKKWTNLSVHGCAWLPSSCCLEEDNPIRGDTTADPASGASLLNGLWEMMRYNSGEQRPTRELGRGRWRELTYLRHYSLEPYSDRNIQQEC